MNERLRFALAMRIGRAALGVNQQQFADMIGTAKSTVARIETLEMGMRAETLAKMLDLLRQSGVHIDLFQATRGDIDVSIEAKALIEAEKNLVTEKAKAPKKRGRPKKKEVLKDSAVEGE
jgi:transcriptional regulator with XRE-family HTH domain